MSVQPSARTFHKTVVHEARIGIWWRCGWLNRNSLCGVLKPLKELVPFYFFFKMKDFSLFGQSNSFPHFGWMSFELTGIDTHILPTNLDSTNVIPFWLLPASYKERSARNMSESQSVNLSCFCFTVHKAPVYNIWQKLQMLRCLFSNASVMLSYTAGKDTRF